MLYRKLAEEELKTNILSTETYQLPSGEEVEKENILYVIMFFSGNDFFAVDEYSDCVTCICHRQFYFNT